MSRRKFNALWYDYAGFYGREFCLLYSLCEKSCAGGFAVDLRIEYFLTGLYPWNQGEIRYIPGNGKGCWTLCRQWPERSTRMNKLIELKNLTKNFDDQQVLRGINLDIYENEFLTLLGPSG